MIRIDVTVSGPRGAGKSRTARALKKFILDGWPDAQVVHQDLGESDFADTLLVRVRGDIDYNTLLPAEYQDDDGRSIKLRKDK